MKQTASWEGKSSFGKQEFLPRSKGRTKSVSLKKVTMLPYPEFFNQVCVIVTLHQSIDRALKNKYTLKKPKAQHASAVWSLLVVYFALMDTNKFVYTTWVSSQND